MIVNMNFKTGKYVLPEEDLLEKAAPGKDLDIHHSVESRKSKLISDIAQNVRIHI